MLDIAVDTYLNNFHLTLDFQVDGGQTTVLLGESGAGKSTVLRSVAGLIHPQKGHIIFDGVIYYDSARRIIVPPQERPFGYVFQDYVLFPHLTVFENVAFGLRAQHLASKIVRQRVEEALEQVHLPGLEQRRPVQLSGGQQQRVAIARALALHPQLLLLDEPLSALDVQTRREVRQELRTILSATGLTTVMVTHQYLDALVFGQQILVLDRGRVIQRGGQRELRETPGSAYIAELVGVNFFQGSITGHESGSVYRIQLITNPGVEIIAALREHVQDVAIGSEVSVIVEPRSITLYRDAPDSSARNVFRGEILQILPLDSVAGREDGRVRVSILLHQGTTTPLTAEITEASAARMQLREGMSIHATFKATEASAYL